MVYPQTHDPVITDLFSRFPFADSSLLQRPSCFPLKDRHNLCHRLLLCLEHSLFHFYVMHTNPLWFGFACGLCARADPFMGFPFLHPPRGLHLSLPSIFFPVAVACTTLDFNSLVLMSVCLSPQTRELHKSCCSVLAAT